MDTLKKIFPLSFKYTQDVANLIIGIIIYVVIGIIAGVAIWLTGLIPLPFLSVLLRIVSTVVDVYIVGGIVVQVLVFTKVLK